MNIFSSYTLIYTILISIDPSRSSLFKRWHKWRRITLLAKKFARLCHTYQILV